MLRIDKIIKAWKESAALNDHINLFGPWSETVFLTKSGDLGVVLRVTGVDYESLDHTGQEYAVTRCDSTGPDGAHRPSSLAGHRADPRQAEVHDAD